MALYAISDLHLSLSTDKSMGFFQVGKIMLKELNQIGKIQSKMKIWSSFRRYFIGMTLEQALLDFKFINSLPGKKIILKAIMIIGGQLERRWKIFLMKKDFILLIF